MVGPETEKGLDNEHDSDQSNLIIKPKVQFVQHFISCHSKHWIPLSMLMLLLQACCSESSGVRTVLLMGNTDPCLLRWFKSQNSYLTYSTILCVGSHVCHFGCFYGCIHIYTGCICMYTSVTHAYPQAVSAQCGGLCFVVVRGQAHSSSHWSPGCQRGHELLLSMNGMCPPSSSECVELQAELSSGLHLGLWGWRHSPRADYGIFTHLEVIWRRELAGATVHSTLGVFHLRK